MTTTPPTKIAPRDHPARRLVAALAGRFADPICQGGSMSRSFVRTMFTAVILMAVMGLFTVLNVAFPSVTFGAIASAFWWAGCFSGFLALTALFIALCRQILVSWL